MAQDSKQGEQLTRQDIDREMRRRLGFIVLAGILVIGALFFSDYMPAKVTLSFGVPPKVKTDAGFVERARLHSLQAHVLGSKGDVVARLQSAVTDAPRTPAQSLEVPQGDYVVSVRLFTRDDAVITRSFKLTVNGDITRTLDLD